MYLPFYQNVQASPLYPGTVQKKSRPHSLSTSTSMVLLLPTSPAPFPSTFRMRSTPSEPWYRRKAQAWQSPL